MTHHPHLRAEQLQNLINRARQVLSARRLHHTLGVMHTAALLASAHGLKPEEAALAALLHDQSKELHPDQIRQELAGHDVSIPAEDLAYPQTWHGLHAAEYARRELGIDDPQILEAVALHTTADAKIDDLTKILFIADLCEPNRTMEASPEILKAARADLDEGFRQALLHKTRHVLKKRKTKLHPRAERALAHYLGLRAADLLEPGKAPGWPQPPAPSRHEERKPKPGIKGLK